MALVLMVVALILSGCGGSAGDRAGDDANIVFTDSAGRQLTVADLRGASDTVQREVTSPASIPPDAVRLHNEGRSAGSREDYPKALQLLQEARRLAPDWPYPVYDIAYTYLLLDDSVLAHQHYAEVDRMEPRGFFTTKASLDCLRREREAIVPKGFCKAFARLEWIEDRAGKRALIESIVQQTPAVPQAWKELAVLREGDARRLEAIAKGLEHNPDPDTQGILLINRALILDAQGQREQAVKILGALALDPKSTLSTETLSKAMLARMQH